LIDGVSLRLEPGVTVAIQGPNGSGKSTLLKLIAGIYLPNAGSVLVDNVPPGTFRSEELPRRVGYMATEGEVFRGTIRDNITRFGEESMDRALEIARLLKVDRDVARLPDGFDTMLEGATAERIPPGLRQRIALTRTLAAKPRLLLFDNADRSLDEEGYQLLHSLLGRLHGKATIIIVSDDANLCTLADRNYHFENGRLTEEQPRMVNAAAAAYRAVRL
jgi:ATP-binding cassette subfamily C protein LapB